jgi:hypothetical protein
MCITGAVHGKQVAYPKHSLLVEHAAGYRDARDKAAGTGLPALEHNHSAIRCGGASPRRGVDLA